MFQQAKRRQFGSWTGIPAAVLALSGDFADAAGSGPRGGMSWDGDCGKQLWSHLCGVGNGTTNWSTDTLPTLSDNVSIPAAAPVVQVVGSAVANTISCESGLTINSSLELAGGGVINDLTVNSLAVAALQIDSGEVALENVSSWTGRVGGNGILRNTGLITGVPQITDNVDFINDVQANLLGMTITAGATAVNSAGASFNFTVSNPLGQGTLGGAGTFANHGQFFTSHLAGSTLDISCTFLQDAGEFNVIGATTGLGTRFLQDATFTGGTMTVADNSSLRFQDPGGIGAVYTFAGLPAITGSGNVYVETPASGDWRVEEQGLNVNLTGADGFVMNSTYLTLNGVLTNQGKALWTTSRLRGDPNCVGCAPEFRNEGTLAIYTSGVVLDTFLSNEGRGTIVHEVGGLTLEEDGVVVNFGTYEHRRGGIARAFGSESGSFSNHGTYKRPNHPDTQDETIRGPFVLNPGSTARYEKATTTYIENGLFMLGGDVIIEQGATLRASTAEAQNANTFIDGNGQFRVEGFGGNGSFLVTEPGVTVRTSLSGASGGGFVLGVGGRIGGPGRVRNTDDMIWAGGTVGLNGDGELENGGDCLIQSGIVNQGGFFYNDDEAEVLQAGPFSLNSGIAENDWLWTITSGNVQGTGMHEFKNYGGATFRCSVPAAQTATVSARFNNLGNVHADSGTLRFTGPVLQINGTVLAGGTWIVDPGATLDLPTLLTEIGPEAGVDNRGDFPDLQTVIRNRGRILNDGGEYDNSRVINEGEMMFETESGIPLEFQGGNGTRDNDPPQGGSTLSYMDTPISPALTGAGDGDIPFALRSGNLNTRSLVRPGGPTAAGPFKMDGNFNQFDTGVLQIDLGGMTPVDEHAQLIVDGNVSLDGFVEPRILLGAAFEGGEQFTIVSVSNGTISGTFDGIHSHGQYSLAYSPTSVTLSLIAPPHPGDTNNDGITDVDDLINIILGWGMCLPAPTFCAADLNGDGAVDVDDLIAVILGWG